MRVRVALSLAAVALAAGIGLAQTKSSRPPSGSLAYSRLNDKARDLFDRWAVRQNQPPPQAYESLTVSQRTVYEAATHALSRSRLTDESGTRIGLAIDLVDSLESILGEDKSVRRGDLQFRLYVRLAPGARQKLGEAREFKRDKDNTVFHKGYPVSYRQRGFYPSIQFSMTPDAARADIDVDYNSSRIPQALFNGHLRASNSDVRAGANYVRHIFKWTGLLNWWPRLFAPRADEPAGRAPADVVEADLPDGAKIDRIEDATQEFFNDWLVRRNLRSARGAYAPAGAACLNADADAENEVLNPRDAHVLFAEMLQASSTAIGRARSLTTAIEAVAPWDPDMKVVPHPNEAFFTLVSVSDAEAQDFTCERPAADAGAAAPPAYGTYYQTIFTIKTKSSEGSMILLWKKDNESWRIVSFDVLDP